MVERASFVAFAGRLLSAAGNGAFFCSGLVFFLSARGLRSEAADAARDVHDEDTAVPTPDASDASALVDACEGLCRRLRRSRRSSRGWTGITVSGAPLLERIHHGHRLRQPSALGAFHVPATGNTNFWMSCTTCDRSPRPVSRLTSTSRSLAGTGLADSGNGRYKSCLDSDWSGRTAGTAAVSTSGRWDGCELPRRRARRRLEQPGASPSRRRRVASRPLAGEIRSERGLAPRDLDESIFVRPERRTTFGASPVPTNDRHLIGAAAVSYVPTMDVLRRQRQDR